MFLILKGGTITHFSEISSGAHEAIVSGTEEYTVDLKVNNNIIAICPYDMESYMQTSGSSNFSFAT